MYLESPFFDRFVQIIQFQTETSPFLTQSLNVNIRFCAELFVQYTNQAWK